MRRVNLSGSGAETEVTPQALLTRFTGKPTTISFLVRSLKDCKRQQTSPANLILTHTWHSK